jgi:LPS sulfotransferase NodH
MLPEGYEAKSFMVRLRRGLKGEILAARNVLRPLPQRFVIFAQGRSGSTLLTSLLDSHPQICCANEILWFPRIYPILYVENAARDAGTSCFGFHVKCYQLSRWQRVRDLRAFIQKMHERGWKIIYLWRENIFEQSISNIFAESAGRYHFNDKEQYARPKTLHIDATRLVQLMRERLAFQALEREALVDTPYFELRYERDLLDPAAREHALHQTLEYIGVEQVPLHSPLKKSVDRQFHEIIENYEEITSALRQNTFEGWLNKTCDYTGTKPGHLER